jgi:hypothetical protein
LFLSNKIDYNNKYLKHIEKLISLFLEKAKPEQSIYKEYLIWGHIVSLYGFGGFSYFLYEKLGFWRNGFSHGRCIYKTVQYYKNLIEGVRYIRNPRDKSVYINNYINENFPKNNRYLIGSSGLFKLNISRTFGKIALILLTIRKHGMSSPEFLELKSTDIFINELSGRPFEIIAEGNETFIILDEEFKLNLEKIDYKKQHIEILKSFRHFDLESELQIRSIFYSFEFE